jgi:hypothetical protein
LKELKLFKENPRGSKNMRLATLAFLGLMERPFLFLYIQRAFDKGLITGLISEFINNDFLLTLYTHVTQLSKTEAFRMVNGNSESTRVLLARVSHSLFSCHNIY